MAQELVYPKRMTLNFALNIIAKSEFIFYSKNKQIKDQVICVKNVQEANIFGLLIIYKVIEFAVNNGCFNGGKLRYNNYMQKMWEQYNFFDLMNAFFVENFEEKNISKEIKGLDVQSRNNCIIAPQPLLRDDVYSDQYLKTKFLPKIREYYKESDKAILMILTCFSEIVLNFWEHAKEDNKSIMIADGNKNTIEIACADTGDGIISTLSNSFSKDTKKEDILEKALEKKITSKRLTNHMGFGLFVINEIVKAVNGKLALFSEGYYYEYNGGKIIKGRCGYWKGTIIYLSLPLKTPKTLIDLTSMVEKNHEKLKINFG